MFETLLAALADYTAVDITLRIFFGAVIGLCLGLTGVGGGVLIIPILRGVFAMSPIMAVGTASLCAAMMKVNAGFMHLRVGNVEWKSITQVLCGAAPALLLTSMGIISLSENPETAAMINQVVEFLIIGVIAFSMIAMTKRSNIKAEPDQKESGFFNPKIIMAGAATGIVMGATGVGGGILLLPLLSVTLGLDMKKSVGSSVIIALVLSTAAALTYSGGGQSDILTAVLLVMGSFIGIPLAGLLMKALSDQRLQQISLGLITISAMVMLRSVFSS